MSKAESAYKELGVKMRNFNTLDRKDIFSHRNISGMTRTMVFKFDDASEVEVHQTFESNGGLMALVSTTAKCY